MANLPSRDDSLMRSETFHEWLRWAKKNSDLSDKSRSKAFGQNLGQRKTELFNDLEYRKIIFHHACYSMASAFEHVPK
jgi:hypothetical protein